MADNVPITPGTGTTIAADDVNGVLYQRVKVAWGPDGTGNDTDVASGQPLPVQLRSSTGTELALATEAGNLASIKSKTDNLDVALSTRLKPADTLTKVTTVDTITNPVAVTGTFWQATQPVSGTVTANAGTNLNTSLLALEAGGNLALIKAKTDNIDVALSTRLKPADTLAAVTSITNPVASTQSGTWTVQPGNIANTTAWKVDGSAVTQPVSGTFWQATQPVSAASLPLPSGASTSAKQPALGTAGSASSDVLTVQGIASMTALKVDGSGVTQPVSGTFWQGTQPVSGTVTSNQGGTWTVQPGNTANTTAWKVDGSAVTQPVSGTFWQATQPVSGTFWQGTQPVSIASMPSTPVTGTFWQATQPVSATSLPLPSNAAQETGGNLASLVTTFGNSKVSLDSSENTLLFVFKQMLDEFREQNETLRDVRELLKQMAQDQLMTNIDYEDLREVIN